MLCWINNWILSPFQSKIVKASPNNTSSDPDICIKMVTPNDKSASMQYDFTEEMWEKVHRRAASHKMEWRAT